MVFGVRIAGALFSFALNVLIARRFGAQEAGLYFLGLNIITILALFSRLGLENSILRFTARSLGENDLESLRQNHIVGIVLCASFAIFCGAGVYFFSGTIAETILGVPELGPTLRILGIAIIPFSLTLYQAESYKGLGRVLIATLLQNVAASGLMALLLIGLGLRISSVEYLAWVYLVVLSTLLAASFLLWGHPPSFVAGKIFLVRSRRLIEHGFPLMIIMLLAFGMSKASSFFLARWGQPADVSLFEIAQRCATVPSFFLMSVNTVVAPRFASLYNRGKTAELANLVRTSTVVIILVSVPVLLVIVVFSTKFLALFGPEFPAAKTVLYILAAGQIVNSATGSVGVLLMMTGQGKGMKGLILISATVNIVLNVVLIQMWAINGAALATAGSLVLMNLSFVALAWHKLGILTIPFVKNVRVT